MQAQKNPKRVVVVGDVHGQFDPFVKILRHAKLIDGQNNWCGGHDRLVQMGDIFDRGPFSRKVDDLLDTIQQQAKTAGEKMTRQVLCGDLRAAYAYKGYLFTHAGVTHKLYRIFQMQLDEPSSNNLAVLINLIFKESIKHEFFKHPIFNISIHRKGVNRFGGIFWEDLDDLVSSYPASPVWQIVGHTQVVHIVVDKTARIIPVDVGLHRKLQYLVLDEKGVPEIVDVPDDQPAEN